MRFTPALATNFAHGGAHAGARAGEGTPLAPLAIVDAALAAGARALVLDDGFDRDRLELVLVELERRREELPLLALEAPCPRVTRPGVPAPSLCAPERDERRVALEAAVATVRRAATAAAPYVVVAVGAVRGAEPDWIYARERFLRGQLDATLARQLAAARDRLAARALDDAARALDRLAREAERAGVTLLVRNGRRYIDVPNAAELDRLRAELAGAPLEPLCDLPAALLPDLMGFQPLALTLAAFGRAPLVYFGDACGPLCGLPPGRGQLALADLAAALAERAELAFRPWGGLDRDEIAAGLAAVGRVQPGPRR